MDRSLRIRRVTVQTKNDAVASVTSIRFSSKTKTCNGSFLKSNKKWCSNSNNCNCNSNCNSKSKRIRLTMKNPSTVEQPGKHNTLRVTHRTIMEIILQQHKKWILIQHKSVLLSFGSLAADSLSCTSRFCAMCAGGR